MPKLDFGVGSHAGPLAAVVAKVSRVFNSVLECGTGDYSTPLLHVLCHDRRLVSAETDQKWFKKYESLASDKHEFVAIKDWRETSILEMKWDIAFVDHSPGEDRIATIVRLQPNARYIVVHDWDADIPPSGGNYGWKTLDGRFKYVSIWDKWTPSTAVLSDEAEFKF